MKEISTYQTDDNNLSFKIEDGIFYFYFNKPCDLDWTTCKSIVKALKKISNGEKQYWCFNFEGIDKFTSDGKVYLAKRAFKYMYACAFLVHNHVQKGNVLLFLSLYKLDVPMKNFSVIDDAVAWLKEMREQTNSGDLEE